MDSTALLPKQDHPQIKILIVDDMPRVRQGLRQLLELTGQFAIVAEAGDGQEAVVQASAATPDAAIMDLEMPGMDGYEATRRIKAQNPTIRVIALSAYASPDEITRALAAGVDCFVVKGAPYEVLVNAIIGKNNPPASRNT